jgi:hypothetical protein
MSTVIFLLRKLVGRKVFPFFKLYKIYYYHTFMIKAMREKRAIHVREICDFVIGLLQKIL